MVGFLGQNRTDYQRDRRSRAVKFVSVPRECNKWVGDERYGWTNRFGKNTCSRFVVAVFFFLLRPHSL